MNLPTDYVDIGRPAPLWVPVEVAKETSIDDTTNEQCIYEVLDNNRSTDRKLSMEFLEIPQLSLNCLPLLFFAGGVVAAAAPLAVVEAVTAPVSVLPVDGSDLLTGLSAAAGVTDQLFLDSGSILEMAYVNLMITLSGNQVQKQFNY